MLFKRVESEMSERDGARLIGYTWIWSLALLVAAFFAAIYTGVGFSVFDNLITIWTSPAKLVTDYFNIGGLASAFLNAAICGLAMNIIMSVTKVRPTALILAGYFLVIAHCFYGLNFVNMWPPFLGVMLFCYFEKKKLGPSLHLAMFSTALGPFISDFLFRYTIGDKFVFGEPQVTVTGCVIAIIFGLLAGFIIPSLLPGTTKTHRGHNLYKAGLAIGLFGIFAYALFYKTLGVATPDAVYYDNEVYAAHGNSYIYFMNIFFVIMFVGTFLWGFFINGRSFKNYKTIWKCDGWDDNFPKEVGMPATFINIGIYGLCILAFINAVILLTKGEGFTGPTAGAIIAAVTFSAAGQTPRNVWPIAAGYTLFYFAILCVSKIAGVEMEWSLSTQVYINGFAFATGLCPFAGQYGWKYGIIAGVLNAVLCSSTAAMHGGFVLYNGGFTAGLTALIMLPIMDYYGVQPKNTDKKHLEKK